MTPIDPFLDDFTECGYREALRLLLQKRRPVSSAGLLDETGGGLFFLRHDVDMSWQRAVKLARMEYECGIRSTFFLHLHSEFYNAFEPAIIRCIHEVQSLGHHLGLHFDPNRYRVQDKQELIPFIAMEKQICCDVLGARPTALSLHNPDVSRNWIVEFEAAPRLLELDNVYSKKARENFTYVSDSNGYWRFTRLFDVLLDAGFSDNLHILIHPEWWTPVPLTPRERVDRCIDGRARALHASYDTFLSQHSRVNIGESQSPLIRNSGPQ